MPDAPRGGEPPPSPSFFRWRRADQPAVAAVLCLSALLVGLFVLRLWRAKQGVIDIDDRPSRQAQLQVDLNLAPWPEFANLPGIGEFLGRSIVSYREQHGDFQQIEELTDVPGIGDTRFNQIKTYLMISLPHRD